MNLTNLIPATKDGAIPASRPSIQIITKVNHPQPQNDMLDSDSYDVQITVNSNVSPMPLKHLKMSKFLTLFLFKILIILI